MISRLPGWAWIGSAVLALIAGAINAIGFLGFEHQGITHLTGSTTLLGVAAIRGDEAEWLRLLAVIGSFMGGCILSGFLMRGSALKLGRRYGVSLVIESALLFIAVPFLERHHAIGDYLASFAMGLQNGMVSTFSGAMLRTTHVTGLFTDLGILIGHWLRGTAVDVRVIRLCSMLLGAFFSGAVLGAIGFSHFKYKTLFFPAALTGCVGFAYGIYRHYHRDDPESVGET